MSTPELSLRRPPSLARRARHALPGLLFCGFVIGTLAAALLAAGDAAFLAGARGVLAETGLRFWRQLSSEILLSGWFYGVFAGVLLLEHLVPAQRSQRIWSVGLRQDAAWVFVKMLAHASLLPIYLLLLQHLYRRHLSFLTIDAVADWPWLARVVLALLVGDFLFWVTHLVRHHVQALWYFHAVHHSQRELNFFTEYRVHPIDDVFVFTIGVVPLFMVQHAFETILAVVWLRHWHTRIYHSNIRSNFGLLRYVLVTPQSHRVHHSIEPRHHDKNFGLTFSLWDHLFGTQYRGYDEYPETGINDLDFPFEQDKPRLSALGNVFEQLFYPFRALTRVAADAEPAAGGGAEPASGTAV